MVYNKYMTTLRYNYRLRPGTGAVEVLLSEWHCVRWLWNQMVSSRKQARPFFKGSDLTAARKRLPWLRAGSQNVQEQTMQTFAGKGKRNFKKKRELPSLQYSRNGFSIKDGRLRLAGGILIPVVWHRELPSIPSSVRVVQDSLGHWYASFVVEVEETFLPEADANIGIDWGVATIATTTDSAYDFESPQFAKASAAKLAKYQRRMARRKPAPGKKASNGYKTAKRDAAKLHKKVARQRQHTTRQWARNVVANHQLIAVEGFRTKFLFQTTMARKAADNAVGQAKRELITYAQRAGRKVVIVPPAYTTMTCSSCRSRNKTRIPLSERIFTCETCNYTAGRDRNAAKTILVQAENNLTNVETIRHATTPQGDLLRAS
jgi:putative transposase